MKIKTVFVCSSCGYKTPKWMGRCSKCEEFNTFSEEEERTLPKGKVSKRKENSTEAVQLKRVETGNSDRIVTSIKEFNRVVGGGLVKDSVTIVASPPGGGKSTLTLAIANDAATKGLNVLYASGEESESQIKSRADRIFKSIDDKLWIMADTCLDNILAEVRGKDCDLIVIDSIQTFQLDEFLPSRAGSPTQTMECAGELVALAKGSKKPVAVIIIGQMNKNDELAGLRSLEHLVDTVLVMDGDNEEELRSLIATKNRFGSTGEMGFFSMTEAGLISIDNPSEFFVTQREEAETVSGCAITVIKEGSRPVIAEVESLVSRSFTPYPTRIGEALRREQLNTLISVLEQRCGISLFDKNVVVKTTGGLKLREQAGNLAIMMCIASSVFDKPIGNTVAFISDVGLTGELQKVPAVENRIKELDRMGFKKVYVPTGSVKNKNIGKIEVKELKYLLQVINDVFK